MGCTTTIDADRFPAQGSHWGKQVRVCFNYDTSRTLLGLVVRDDAEDPGRMIIKLDDGRHVLATECQWQPLPANAEAHATDARSEAEGGRSRGAPCWAEPSEVKHHPSCGTTYMEDCECETLPQPEEK